MGMIVYAEAKAHNNSWFYVIDDGTGWIDCVAWGESEESVYALPALTGVDHHTKPVYRVGDRVRIFGRIECVSVSETKQKIQVDQKNVVEVRGCIPEIHVFSPVTDSTL